jgi:hypothetical protein
LSAYLLQDNTVQQKTDHFLSASQTQLLFHKFSAAYYDFILSFIPARQDSEIILNETSKSIFLAHLVSLKSEKLEMPGNF